MGSGGRERGDSDEEEILAEILGVDRLTVRGMELFRRGSDLMDTPGRDERATLTEARELIARAAELFDGRAPAYWATAQSTLSRIHERLADADPDRAGAHEEQAIEYRLAAMRAPDRESEYRADDHYHLARLYGRRIAGSRPDNRALAITHARAAIDGYPRTTAPVYWSDAQHVLGDILLGVPDASAACDTDEAIACFDRALEIRSPGRDVVAWARTQWRRGVAFDARRTGSRSGNVEAALACFDTALGRLGADDDPSLWARLHHSASVTLAAREAGDHAENAELALGHLQQCLVVFTRDGHPEMWASTPFSGSGLRRARCR